MATVHSIWIDGKWVTARAAATREVKNPATLETLGGVPDCGPEDVAAAVTSARRAQGAWWRMPGVEKALLLHEIARRIRADGKALSTLLTKESGKPLCESVDCIEWVAACFDYYAEVGRTSHGNSVPPVAHHQINFTVKEPYGVVAAIVPFNFPLLLASWKLAPALMAGNTVVLKPPHQNPLSLLRLAESLSNLPPGVVNVVTGAAATGETLVGHPDVDLIAFTGSIEAGRKVAVAAASQLKKVNLELGSVDPFIVFEDADLEVAVPGVAWARLLNAGQVCTSAKRIYLVKEIAQAFTEKLVAYVKTLKVGDPMDPETDVGPLISAEALVKVQAQVAKAAEEGGKVLIGGKKGGASLAGHYFEPTVISNVRHGSSLTTDEVFGPVIALTTAKDADEAIAMANDSKYGLGANVYTRSLEYAMRAMENIKAGTFWVNDPLTDNDAAPFGGMRQSGVGRELGEEGLDAFREPKHVHLDYRMEKKAYWYPYRNRPIPGA